MTKNDIIAKVKELHLPEGGYIVFGSCPLAAAGLREANDIDLFVTDEVLASLRLAGWAQNNNGKDDGSLALDGFEAHDNWDFGSYGPTLQQLLKTADFFDDVPFVSLDEVRKWKLSSGRPKDFKDIALIDAYLAR